MRHSLDTNLFDYVISPETNPAAGADKTITIPGQVRILPVALRFSLVTDANGANRTVLLQYNDGTRVYHAIAHPAVQTASLTRDYNFMSGSVTPFVEATDDHRYAPLSPGIFLLANHTLEISVINIQATDQLANIVLTYHRWIFPL